MLGKRGRQWINCGAIVAMLIGIVAFISFWRVSQRTPWYRDAKVPGNVLAPLRQADGMESRIRAFCGNCHAMPSAASFPRDAWHNEVLRGYEFYARSGMNHLDPPPIHATVDYFRSRASEELVFPVVPEATTPLRARFTCEKRTLDGHGAVAPAIAQLRWARLQAEGAPLLLACDMRGGDVTAVNPNEAAHAPKVLARLNNPCHGEPCDLDGDGAIDLVVADLGSFVPYDHNLGRVVWLRRDEQRNKFEEIVLASGLGRVADVRPGDLDGDGDVDLVVADFGLHTTGQILLLQNISDSGEAPEFLPRQIDPRPGGIHVPVADLNGDGRLDFLGLISQNMNAWKHI